MQTQKMSLANIKGKLSRSEMKKIMAGSEEGCAGNACGPHGKGTCQTAVSGCTCKDYPEAAC